MIFLRSVRAGTAAWTWLSAEVVNPGLAPAGRHCGALNALWSKRPAVVTVRSKHSRYAMHSWGERLQTIDQVTEFAIV